MADKLARAEKAIESNPFVSEAWGQILREAHLFINSAEAKKKIEQLPLCSPTNTLWDMPAH